MVKIFTNLRMTKYNSRVVLRELINDRFAGICAWHNVAIRLCDRLQLGYVETQKIYIRRGHICKNGQRFVVKFIPTEAIEIIWPSYCKCRFWPISTILAKFLIAIITR